MAWLVPDPHGARPSRVWTLPAYECPECEGIRWTKWRFWNERVFLQHELHECVQCHATFIDHFFDDIM